jgi:hypothetical protein
MTVQAGAGRAGRLEGECVRARRSGLRSSGVGGDCVVGSISVERSSVGRSTVGRSTIRRRGTERSGSPGTRVESSGAERGRGARI